MREMLNKRRNRAESGEEGFTLIELMVVVLIIGILLAIAVPTFLSAQKNAKNKAATSNVRSALSAVKTIYADKQTYTLTASDLTAAEPSLNWVTTMDNASTGPQVISWNTTAATSITLAAMSKLNVCFFVKDDTATGTTYARANVGTGGVASCKASLMPAGTNSADSWSDS